MDNATGGFYCVGGRTGFLVSPPAPEYEGERFVQKALSACIMSASARDRRKHRRGLSLREDAGCADHPRAAGGWLGAGSLLDPVRRSRWRAARIGLRARQRRVRRPGQSESKRILSTRGSRQASDRTPTRGGFASRSLHRQAAVPAACRINGLADHSFWFMSLLAQSGHALLHCKCPLMTQSGHYAHGLEALRRTMPSASGATK